MKDLQQPLPPKEQIKILKKVIKKLDPESDCNFLCNLFLEYIPDYMFSRPDIEIQKYIPLFSYNNAKPFFDKNYTQVLYNGTCGAWWSGTEVELRKQFLLSIIKMLKV